MAPPAPPAAGGGPRATAARAARWAVARGSAATAALRSNASARARDAVTQIGGVGRGAQERLRRQALAALGAPASARARAATAGQRLRGWRAAWDGRVILARAGDRARDEALFYMGLLGLARAPDLQLPALRPRRYLRSDGPATVLGLVASLVSLLAGAGVLLLVITVIAAATAPVVTRNLTTAAAWELEIPDQAELPVLGERSVVYAADGSLLAVLDREVDRKIIPLEQVPLHARQAIITAEDRKFYEHPGYDVEGIARAMVVNARAGDIAQGGSTITQQLAKSIVGNERTLERKATELTYAIALERELSKDELLERYLNQVYFGSRAYGIAAAAEAFFGKDVGDLTLAESALLAGLVRSPSGLDPRTNPEGALARRNDVLRGMAEEGYITQEELPALLAMPLEVAPRREGRRRVQPHFVDTVERELLASSALGETFEERQELLYSGGLQIHTTLDPRLQRVAEDVLDRHLAESGPTAAIAVVQPGTGRVLATYGGLDYSVEQYDLATQGRRQPGSAAKPFVYATAVSLGFPPQMTLEGTSPAYFDVDGWRSPQDPQASAADRRAGGVRNYGGASFGRLNMTDALTRSVNTAAAQLMMIVGPTAVADTMQRMGVDVQAATDGLIVPAIALGGPSRGVTPLEMASAFGVFADEGRHASLRVIERVTDGGGQLIYAPEDSRQQVLDPAVNAVMVDMLRGVVERGTGTRARVSGWQVAGKTGTAQDNADAWFVGFTPVLSTAVWVGHAEAKIPMRGMTGGALPAIIWQDFMTQALEGVEPVPFPDVSKDLTHIQSQYEAIVPDVRGLNETQALTALGEARIIGEVREVDSEAPKGRVLWQSPRPGEVVQPGQRVVIGVSTGIPPEPEEEEEEEEAEDNADSDKPDDEEKKEEEEKKNENQSASAPGNGNGGESDGEEVATTD